MKKLLTILFVFACFFASAQKLDSIRGHGFIWERGMFNKSLGIPTICGTPKTNYTDSTKKAQIIYDSCAGKFYAYNPATKSWAEPGGGGVSGVDSLTIIQTGCAFTFYTWKDGVSTSVGTLSQYNGLTPGTGIVTHTSGLTFSVTAAVYAIDCVTYTTRDTTITLPAAGDTGRIDVIKVNTSGVTTYGQGVEGEALPLPSLSVTEIALTYILVTDTGVFVSPPTDTALWVSVGSEIRNANRGRVRVNRDLQVGSYTPGAWDTVGIHTNDKMIAQDGFYMTNPSNSSLTKTGIGQGFGNAVNMWAGSNIVGVWKLIGNNTGNQFSILGGYNPATGGGFVSTYSSNTTLNPTGANSINYTVFDAAPTYTQSAFGTGALRGYWYRPTVTSSNTSRVIAIETMTGDIIHRNLAGSGTRMVVANDSGLLSTQAIPGGGGSQDLQDVTGIDSTTTHEIIVQGARLAAKGFSTMYGNSAGTDDNSTESVGIGYGALSFAAGTQNVGIGVNSLQSVVGDGNVGIGRDAGVNYVGYRSLFIGNNSGDNSIGYGNVGIGAESLSGSAGTHVTAVGDSTGHSNTFDNVSIFGYTAQADSTNQVVLSDGVHQVRLDHALLTGDIKPKWQNRSGTIAYLDDITGGASDTIFVDAPLEAYTSGDSNKIRINPDTLAALRREKTFTIDLSSDDYVMEVPGIYKVTHGSNGGLRSVYFPDPALFTGMRIVIMNSDHADQYDAVFKGPNKPFMNGKTDNAPDLIYGQMREFYSIGNQWRGGNLTE